MYDTLYNIYSLLHVATFTGRTLIAIHENIYVQLMEFWHQHILGGLGTAMSLLFGL